MPESQCRVLEAEGARGLRGARGREMPNCACTSCRLSILALRKRKWLLNHVRLFVTLWTVAHQAPLSMGFSKQEYWSVLPFPSPGDLPHPGIEPASPVLQVDSLPLSHLEPLVSLYIYSKIFIEYSPSVRNRSDARNVTEFMKQG